MKRYIFSISIIVTFCVPTFAGAATLSLTTSQASAGIGERFIVSIILNTENDINAVEAALNIPFGFELENTSDGNTIVNLWVERPRYDRETRILTFSGIIPGGFSGTGQLLTFTLKAEIPGPVTLSFIRARTTVYRNSPDGVEESSILRPLILDIGAEAISAAAPVADTEPPEAFTPVVTRNPQLYEGAWTLLFATQDKGSGIAYYEVSESSMRMAHPDKLAWTKAESPYLLSDQTPARYIYARAVDRQGNIRTELYAQPRPFSWLNGLGLAILGGALGFFIFRRRVREHF